MKGYSVAAMGGYSLLAMAIVFAGWREDWVAPLGILMMFLANFMNHPHFMASYRIFFGIYPQLKSGKFQTGFRLRWWLAAVAIPLGLVVLLGMGVAKAMAGDDSIFKMAIVLYGTSVGWHYVKQGFGMAMSEAALKQCYWLASTRQWLLWNAYACWVFSMCLLFSADGGIGYFGWQFSIGGDWLQRLLLPAALVFGITTVGMALHVSRNIAHWRQAGKGHADFPSAGLMGYLVSLYVWVAAGVAFPLLMLVIPFFHSMQYMHVVEKLYASEDRVNPIRKKLNRWMGLIAIGALSFWLVPGVMDYIYSGKINLVSQMGMLFTAAVWLFINIHHYFIDNVIWRKENKYIWGKLRDC